MAQEDMNITISPEMLQEIIRVASETAIEKYQREAEKSRKAVRDKRLHNTKLLLQNYHCFVEHSKSAVYEASQLSEDDDFEELMEELMSQTDGRVRVPVVRSIQESASCSTLTVCWNATSSSANTPSARKKCAGIGQFTASTSQTNRRISSRLLMRNRLTSRRCSATRKQAFPN